MNEQTVADRVRQIGYEIADLEVELLPREVDFVRRVVKGESKSQAYRNAGYAGKPDNNTSAHASRALATGRKARLLELYRQRADLTTVNHEEWLATSWHEATDTEIPDTTQAGRVRALTLVGGAMGWLRGAYPDYIPAPVTTIAEVEAQLREFGIDPEKVRMELVRRKEESA